MKRQEKSAMEARGGGVVSAEVQGAHTDMEREVIAIIRADPRSGGANEELVAWTAPDPSVIAGVRTDMAEFFSGILAATVCCFPLVLPMCILCPCIFTGILPERNFRRQLLDEAESYIYAMTSCEGRRAYVTVDAQTKSVVWLHTSLWGQRPPRLHQVAGQSWVKDEVEDGKQGLYIMRPDDWDESNNSPACCDSETRKDMAKSRILQVWFVDESTSSPGAPNNTVEFMEQLARESTQGATSAAQPAPGVTSMPGDSDLPTATTAVESGVRLRVCLEGGKVSMLVADTSNFDGFMEQVAALLGVPLGTHMLAFVDVQGDRVELEPSGLHALERDEKVVVVLQA